MDRARRILLYLLVCLTLASVTCAASALHAEETDYSPSGPYALKGCKVGSNPPVATGPVLGVLENHLFLEKYPYGTFVGTNGAALFLLRSGLKKYLEFGALQLFFEEYSDPSQKISYEGVSPKVPVIASRFVVKHFIDGEWQIVQHSISVFTEKLLGVGFCLEAINP